MGGNRGEINSITICVASEGKQFDFFISSAWGRGSARPGEGSGLREYLEYPDWARFRVDPLPLLLLRENGSKSYPARSGPLIIWESQQPWLVGNALGRTGTDLADNWYLLFPIPQSQRIVSTYRREYSIDSVG